MSPFPPRDMLPQGSLAPRNARRAGPLSGLSLAPTAAVDLTSAQRQGGPAHDTCSRLQEMEGVEATSSVSPSACSKGFFVYKTSCPYLLGKGMGPLPYKELYSLWEKIDRQVEFDPKHCEFVKSLIQRIRLITRETVVEGVLSCIVARSMSHIVANSCKSLEVLHQLYVPDKSSFRIDIALLDSIEDTTCAHSLMEIKCEYDSNEFPEIKVTACANWLSLNGAIKCPWIPVFVLSRNHLRIGVAFNGVCLRWAYSEIYSYVGERAFDSDNLLLLLRFTKFICEAAEYHRQCLHSILYDAPLHLVDSNGETLMEIEKVIGYRVLSGTKDKRTVILKFYSCDDDAENALKKHAEVCAILGEHSTVKVVKGCATGLCATMDNYLESSVTVWNEHLRNLTRKVFKLYQNGWIHGDLRRCNIVFGKDGSVHLIDFDWSGRWGEAMFPRNVRVQSFGKRASQMIAPGGKIPRKFDLLCLADILDSFGYQVAALAAEDSAESVINALPLSRANDHQIALLPANLVSYLDLSCLGLHFYNRKQFPSEKRQKHIGEGKSMASGSQGSSFGSPHRGI